MSKSIRKILMFVLILVAITTLCVTVKAATIKETTNANDEFDTIENGTIVIGVTKFTPDQKVITATKAAIAGANDRQVYSLKNVDDTNYSYAKVYYYLDNEWFELDAENKATFLKDGIASLDIYYVNNKLKEGISLPTKPVEKSEYTVFFVDGEKEVSKKVVVEGEKVGELPTLTAKPHFTYTWTDKAGNAVTANTSINSDTVIFAKWTEEPKATMTLKVEGQEDKTVTAYVGENLTVNNPAIRTVGVVNYDFNGWYTEDGKEYTISTMPAEGITLKAAWNATVTNIDEFEAGVENATELTTITLGDNITGIAKTLNVNKKVTIEGNGKTLGFAELQRVDGTASGLVISAEGTVVNDLTVEMTEKAGWQGNYAIQVYNTKGVVLNNVTTKNADGGIRLNGSEVELKGTTTLNNNEFGGIEVSKGAAADLNNSKLTVTADATIVMDNEAITRPVIWIEGGISSDIQGTVEGLPNTYYKVEGPFGKDQVYYYSSKDMATTVEVGTLDELKTALTIEQIKTINLTADISDIDGTLYVNRKVTLNGNGKTLQFRDFEKVNNVASGLVINSEGTVVNDLIVDRNKTNLLGAWGGKYALQVYNTQNVVLNNVTAKNGDVGILINSSKAKLTGTTNVTGNKIEGIEVSRGENLSENSELTIDGTITMDDESNVKPVFLIEGTETANTLQGTIIGLPDTYYKLDGTSLGADQTYYYSSETVATTAKVNSSAELKTALQAGYNVILTDNVVLDEVVTISNGANVVFDTNNYNVTSTKAAPIFVVSNGTLEIKGNGKIEATTEIAQVYEGGEVKITGNGNYISKSNVVLYSGSVKAGQEAKGGKITIEGGNFKGQEGCVITTNGGELNITDGEFTAIDNAIIAGNGTKASTDEIAETTINITGGTFNGGITSGGYIAMGIYHPQKGTLNVTGGTFNITKGSGIIMRSGTLNLTGATFNYNNEDETFKGWAGDKKSQIPVGKDVVKCTHAQPAGYAYNVVLQDVDATYTVLEFAE